jgi:hypothetical protein
LLVFMYYLTWNKCSSVILFSFIKSFCYIISEFLKHESCS